jgi:hypothetical protein
MNSEDQHGAASGAAGAARAPGTAWRRRVRLADLVLAGW